MSQKTVFTIENAGNQPASIAGIQLVNGQASLRLEGIPDAPFMLGSGETTTFGINFTPTAVGTFTDVLLIGQSSFDVSGAGLKPPSLPDYELKSSISSITPAQQGSISLRLAEPYPLKLSGTIRLRISPNSVGVDPAAQFAVSGRTVNFRIAPNSTEAVFDDGSQAAQFQVGTVTSTLIFVPSFATVGEVDVTPDNPATLSLFLPPSPPSLLNARITDVTSTGFAVSVNGISSNKSLLSIDMTLVSADGGVARRSVDLKSFSQVWFGTALSDPYGGLFSVTVPFRVPVGGSRVQSITLTVRNELGDSNSLTVQNP
jgi:hypothetical protein